MLGNQQAQGSRCLTLATAIVTVVSGCSRDTLEPDRSARTAHPLGPVFSSSTASGYVLISQPDSMGPQDLSFGRSLLCPVGKRIFGGGVQNATYGVVAQETYPKP